MIKHKSFAFINIAGLSIGISVCFIIMLFVQDELSFDRFNEKRRPDCTDRFQGKYQWR